MLARGDVHRRTMLDAVGPLLALQVSKDVDWMGQIPCISNRYTKAVLGEPGCPLVDGPTFAGYVHYLQHIGFLPAASGI